MTLPAEQVAVVPPAVETRALGVHYGSVPALQRVNLVLRPGEITCVLGENGSGKSTLVAVLSGLQRHDEGELLVAGTPTRFRSPRQARAAGIATVWQDLAVAPLLSIWRNFFLGAEPTRGTWPLRRLDLDRARETTLRAMARVGVTGLDPDEPASALQAGERHSLAVARALHFGARALVLDEVTAPLTVAQHALVLQSVVAARREGMAVLYVTNNPRLAGIVGDRFFLLAHGAVAGNFARGDIDVADLTRLMAGGEDLAASLSGSLTELFPELREPLRASGEHAHPAGPDQQADDDEHDSPQHLAAEDREDAGDDQHDRDDPEDQFHDGASDRRPPLGA